MVCVVTIIFLIGGFFLSPPGVAETQAILYRYVFARSDEISSSYYRENSEIFLTPDKNNKVSPGEKLKSPRNF
ncbi:hypothetical protein [Methanoregula sp.]|uniref:hypothetical protein n=1 Tax=Methanoregula sp. TaxID=2052170 RepID=UPI003C74B10F